MIRVAALLGLVGCDFSAGAGSADAALPRGDGPLPADASHDGPTVTHDTGVPTDTPTAIGLLTVTASTLGSMDINVSNEGTTDWVHWGFGGTSGFDRKSGGTAISNLTSSPESAFTGGPLSSSWTGGTPHSSESMTSNGVIVTEGGSMTFTVAADATTRTLELYAGAQKCGARLDVSLSDASATAQSQSLTDQTSVTNDRYTITFAAGSAGQTLTVTSSDLHDYAGSGAFAALIDATLQ